MKNNQQFERIGTLSLEEVFPLIKENFNNQGTKRVFINQFFVNVQSLRLRTFLHTGVQCSCCDTIGSFFAVERNPVKHGQKEIPYHLNLYGYNKEGEEVIFTHDHIVARGLGGNDDLSNTITSCGPCNWKKGKLELKVKSEGQENQTLNDIVTNSQIKKLNVR